MLQILIIIFRLEMIRAKPNLIKLKFSLMIILLVFKLSLIRSVFIFKLKLKLSKVQEQFKVNELVNSN